MKLRYYQQAAINAVAEHLANKGTNPCIEIPTGGGKSPVIACLAAELVHEGNRVLCLAHRKELLEQTADKLDTWAPGIDYGIYSAGLNQRQLTNSVIIAGIQSIYKKGVDISQFGNIDFVIVDEAHLIPPSQETSGGMYRQLIDDLTGCNPDLTVIGLTATPYRLGSGNVCGKNNILREICYKVSIKELIAKEFLSPLVSKVTQYETDFSGLRKQNGEFKTDDVDALINVPRQVQSAVNEIVMYSKNRQSVLIFCSSVRHAKAVSDALKHATQERVELVTGDTPKPARESLLKSFRHEAEPTLMADNEPEFVKYLVNVDVLTTGFDAPNVDTVVLLRPTASPGLYYQMVGRGFRLCKNKKECLVLDFGGNIKRHGPVDQITPPVKGQRKTEGDKAQSCPRCLTVLANTEKACPQCGYVFEEKITSGAVCPECEFVNSTSNLYCCNCGYKFPVSVSHDAHSDTDADILSGRQSTNKAVWEESVVDTEAYIHNAKDNSGKQFLRIQYRLESGVKVSEFLSFEEDNENWKRIKAIEWWCKRSKYRPIPKSSVEAWHVFDSGGIAVAKSVKYKPAKTKKDWPQLVSVTADEPPECDWIPIVDTVNVCKNCINFIADGNEEKTGYCSLLDQSRQELDFKCKQFVLDDIPF